MLNLNKVEQIKLKLGVSIILLLLVFYIVLYAHKRNTESSQIVMHSGKVALKIEEISTAIAELESIQRGYIITRDDKFLDFFRSINESIPVYISELKSMLKDSVQLKKLNELDTLLAARLKILNANIETGKPTTRMMLDGKQAMSLLMMKIDEMKQHETSRMKDKGDMFKDWEGKSTIAMVLALNIVIVLILIASFVIISEYKNRANIENQLIINQQQLKEKVEKLDNSNRELEQFAHVASHDLQEPLRKIMTFSDRISEKMSAEVSPDLANYLGRISSAAGRMHILIDDLLAYSRVSKGSTEKIKIDLEQVIGLIKENYELAIAGRNVTFIHHNKLPRVLGDKTQMLLLFQNLIDNAIKFTYPDTFPVIEIFVDVVNRNEFIHETVEPVYDRYYKIVIKDNGIGFDKKHLDKIFLAFQRLHGRSEYKGSGIGLSVCKRIVENHHGYIHAESAPGKGSEFWIYLPSIEE